ncbi:MAG TPA: hypothetical protein VLL07_04985 [Pontiella sp.]|nr:hypothetical protein [Pontiella sp.]
MKAKEKPVSILLAVLAMAVLCVISYMLGGKNASESRSDSMEMEAPVISSGTAFHSDSPPVSHSSSEAAVEAAWSVNDGIGDGGAKDDIAAEQRERLMRNIAQNLAMPGMNEMIQQQQRVLMTDKYRNFIKKLRLNPEEEDYLMDLLTARQMLQVDFGMKLMTGMLSEAERTELMKNLHSGMEELDKEIDWFLNSDIDSEYFRYYDKTEGERAMVLSVENAVSQAGHPLDEGVEEELVAILHEEMNNYPFSVNFEENGEPVFSNFTDANISAFLQELEQLREPVFREASLIMDPDQLEIFGEYYAQYVAFYAQRLRMTQQFFNSNQ